MHFFALVLILENGEKVITGTACSHMFHYSCFLQWVDKGNEHCPYCRENMITADNCNETARQVLGTERVEKLMRINEEAALRDAPEERTVAAGDVQEPDEVPTADNNIEEADLEEGEATEGPLETPNEDIPTQEQPKEPDGPDDAGTDLEVGTTANAVSNKAAPEDIQEC